MVRWATGDARIELPLHLIYSGAFTLVLMEIVACLHPQACHFASTSFSLVSGSAVRCAIVGVKEAVDLRALNAVLPGAGRSVVRTFAGTYPGSAGGCIEERVWKIGFGTAGPLYTTGWHSERTGVVPSPPCSIIRERG